MDPTNICPQSPPSDKAPLEDYEPIRTAPRKAGEDDAVLGAAGRGDDGWAWFKVVLLVFAAIVAAIAFGQR